MTQVRKIVVLSSIVLGVAVLSAACKNEPAKTGPDGGPELKIICKMNAQCWICPSQEALKKCIINPVSSGCKLSAAGDCS